MAPFQGLCKTKCFTFKHWFSQSNCTWFFRLENVKTFTRRYYVAQKSSLLQKLDSFQVIPIYGTLQLIRLFAQDVFLLVGWLVFALLNIDSSQYRPQACDIIKKESLAQVFSCEFCEISKNTFFYRTPPVATSVSIDVSIDKLIIFRNKLLLCFLWYLHNFEKIKWSQFSLQFLITMQVYHTLKLHDCVS